MDSASGNEPDLLLLYITEEDFQDESAATIGLQALFEGLGELGIVSQVIGRSDDAESPPVDGATATEQGSTSELLSMVTAALDRQRPDLAVIRSGSHLAQILATCRARNIPTVVVWEGGDPHYWSTLAGADVVLASSQVMADYLREAFGFPAVHMPPVIVGPDGPVEAAASHIVFDGSTSSGGMYVFAQIAAEINRRRPNTPVIVLGPNIAYQSTTGALDGSASLLDALGVDEAKRAPQWSSDDIWPHARVLLAPLADWQRTPFTALDALSYGVPVVVSDQGPVGEQFGEGALVLPLPGRLTGAAPLPISAAEVATWVETVLRLYDDPAFAARQRSLALMSSQRYSPEALVPKYAHFFRQLMGKYSQSPPATNGQIPVDQLASRSKCLAAEHPWPSDRPHEANTAEQGWLGAGTDTMLARALSAKTRLVVELGAWLGLSTRYIARRAPNAIVASVDHWQGSPEHLQDPRYQELLPRLYETFLSRCWEHRERIIPLRMDSLSGLKAVAAAGLQPDVVFVDAEHSYQAVSAELRLARELFPHAALVGDDYDWPPVRRAVDHFARQEGMVVDRHVARGWRLLEKWQVADAAQPTPGRAQFFVLVPHLNGIEWECEQGLRYLESVGVRVVRRGGCSAIDVARNEMLSDALHDEAEAILFIDADIGFDPQDALRLLARPEDVVAGIYAKKGPREMASTFVDGVKQIRFGVYASDLFPLKYVAAGFMRVRASVLRRIIAELKLPLCNTDWGRGVWPFFQPMVVPRGDDKLHYLGEDWAFSQRLSEIGVTPLADTSIRLWHWGRYAFGWEDAGREVARYGDYTFNI